jgi:hypothetical protein
MAYSISFCRARLLVLSLCQGAPGGAPLHPEARSDEEFDVDEDDMDFVRGHEGFMGAFSGSKITQDSRYVCMRIQNLHTTRSQFWWMSARVGVSRMCGKRRRRSRQCSKYWL